jgi:hypothetical protein
LLGITFRLVAIVSLKLSDDALARFDAKAAEAGMSRHRWMVTMLEFASGDAPLPRHVMQLFAHIAPKPVRDGEW